MPGKIAAEIVRLLASVPSEQRGDVMAEVTSVYCGHCWGELELNRDGGRRQCFCWNDE